MLKLEFTYSAVVNFAMQQNHVPIVRKLLLKNETDEQLNDIKIVISITGELSNNIEKLVTSISKGEIIEIKDSNLNISSKYLSELTEKISEHISITVFSSEQQIIVETYAIDILPFDQWGGIGILPEILTSFVTPNYPSISAIIHRASYFLEKWTDNPSLDEYQSRNPDRVKKQMAAIYEAIAELNIVYCTPPASYERSGQRIRMCDTILSTKLGTCIDMALLYASCLEAVGINPIIVVTKGHAFAGGWLVDDTFADSVNDDISLLTKRTADGINEIALIETTCMNSGQVVSFDTAMTSAEDRLNDTSNFELSIDIKRCRFASIRPLPLRLNGADGLVIIESTPTERNSDTPTTITPNTKVIDVKNISISKQQLWERKLLDLSLRNNLLNIRLTKSTLQLISVNINLLEDALADGHEFAVLPKPTDWDNNLMDAGIYKSINQTDPIIALVQQELTQKRLRSYLTETELGNSLTHLYRSSRLSMEENGANTLYLALGLLKWYETPSSERPRYAPILLLPVEIIRKSAQRGYIIRSREEEVMMNITLLEMLKQDFGIKIGGLDTLPKDDSGVDVKLVFNIIRKGIMSQKRWNVEEQAILGVFSFSKFIMWNDIHNNADKLCKNKIVKSLVSGMIEWETEEDTNWNLDTDFKPSDIALPISADSFQIEAVCNAAENKSFILHGPPGTGKSQTITNIIADALYNGKKVLFVAEKMAALSVVQKRLKEIGIAQFCLELHSNKSKKSAILEQLKATTDVVRKIPPENYAIESERLHTLRTELSQYVDLLHKKHSSGISLYDAMFRYNNELNNACDFEFSNQIAIELNPSKLNNWRDITEQIQAVAILCKRIIDHPLKDIKITNYSQSLKTEIKNCSIEHIALLNRHRTTLEDLLKLFGSDIHYGSFETSKNILDIAEFLLESPLLASGLLRSDNLSDAISKIREIIPHGILRDKISGELLSKFSKNILALDAEKLLMERIILLNRHKFTIEELLKLLGANIYYGSVEVSENILDIAEFLLTSPLLSSSMLRAENLADAISKVREIIPHGTLRDKVRAKLLSEFSKNILTIDADKLLEDWNISKTKWFLPRYFAQRKITNELSGYSLTGIANKDKIAETLKEIINYQTEKQIVESNSSYYSHLLGVLWRDGECDWNIVEESCKFALLISEKLLKLSGDIIATSKLRVLLADNLSQGIDTFLSIHRDKLVAYSTTYKEVIRNNEQLTSKFEINKNVDSSNWINCELSGYLLTGVANKDRITDILKEIINYQTEKQIVESNSSYYSHLLGMLWRDGECNWDMLEQTCKSSLFISEKLLKLSGDIAIASKLRGILADNLSQGIDLFLSIHKDKLATYSTSFKELVIINQQIISKLEISPILDSSKWIDDNIEMSQNHIDNIDQIRDWCSWNNIEKSANESGLNSFIKYISTNEIEANRIVSYFDKAIYKSIINTILDSEPILANFNGKLFEDKIRKFRELTYQFERYTRDELFAKLASNIPSFVREASQSSEVGILQRNIRSNGRGTSIRRLFDTIPTLLTRINPCMLMSPMSVAQYIDADNIKFDLVIFDEASQMPTCEAVGAIARGHNVIIVGDPKQMPPTNFFSSNSIDEDNLDKEDLESILDDCLALSMPSKHLLWHYRSKHESLIAFSNSQYYDNNLLTFPSPDNINSKVTYQQIEGFYDKGKSRQNRAEAEAVVKEILTRLSNDELSKRSIGVVTFSSVQQSLIEDLLNQAFISNPQIEAIALESKEPLFIKNLENVQGDERDIILFSIGYGPDKEGKVSLNFGPLNRNGGWRRLNVAVSRARYEMKIFSTLHADQIDLSRTSSEGMAGLKAFLEYAENGKNIVAIRDKNDHISNDSINKKSLVDIIANQIREHGHEVHTNIGCSGYRVDIGIVNPDKKSEYTLGILCDGANYRAAKTVRDREVIQQDVLKLLGWNIHRLWTMDWIENSENVLLDIIAAITNSSNKALHNDTQSFENKTVEKVEIMPKVIDEQLKSINNLPTESKYKIPYQEFHISFCGILAEEFTNLYYIDTIARQISNIVELEAPISRNQLCRKVLSLWGISRIGSRIDRHFNDIFSQTNIKHTGLDKEQFFWRDDQTPSKYMNYRTHTTTAMDISPEEVSVAVKEILEDQISLSKEDLIKETARILGYGRLGTIVEASMKRGINMAIKRNFAKKEENNRIIIVE